MDKMNIFIHQLQSASWVAQRFAQEQQLKDKVDEEEEDSSDSDYTPPRGHYRSTHVQGKNRRASHFHGVPHHPGHSRGSKKYFSNLYAREDKQVRSMKFGEEIGTRCYQKLLEKSQELNTLTWELRQLSGQVNSLVDIKAEDHGQAILTASALFYDIYEILTIGPSSPL